MKKRLYRQSKKPGAIGPHARQMRSHASLRWLISAALCCVVFICILGIANAAQSTGPTLTQKMQSLQQMLKEGRAHTRPKLASQNQVPAVQPAPIRHAGIASMGQGPFPNSIFAVYNLWQGTVGKDWVLAYTGVKRNADGTPGRGGVVLYTETMNNLGGFDVKLLGTFLAPSGTTALTASSWHESLLLLHDKANVQLTFNLVTHQFQ